MNVLSLFDGISCGRLALDRAGVKYDKYYAAEIDKHAIKVARKNYPDTIHIGDVTKVLGWEYSNIGLVIGGSPCQSFSIAGDGSGFDGKSKLFFEYVRILREVRIVNPEVKFLLENVKMKQEWKDMISRELGVEPVEINSTLVSAQNRKRLYWTNIHNVSQPEDKGLVLKDILEDGFTDRQKSFCLDANYHKGGNLEQYFEKGRRQLVFDSVIPIGRINSSQDGIIVSEEGKAPCLMAGHNNTPKVYLDSKQIERAKQTHQGKTWKSGNKMGSMRFPVPTDDKAKTLLASQISGARETNHIKDEIGYRKLTPIECERLQTLPDNWTEGISNTQRYKAIGNGWTVDVIAHIFKGLLY